MSHITSCRADIRRADVRRADIQGLRAFAVAFVVLDHVLGGPAGGFVGVDVFFVISGFLITQHLLSEVRRQGRISLVAFFLRRIKRLFPAAALVLVTTVTAAIVLLPASRARVVLVDGVWAALLGANWRFASTGTDYFASDDAASPLQHFWSLAVEEQFYLVWPLLLAAACLLSRRRRPSANTITMPSPTGGPQSAIRVAIVSIGIVSLVSFAWALHESGASPQWAYFSTASRAWEFGVGAVLATGAQRLARLPQVLRSPLAWVGYAGLVTSVLVISPECPVPAPGGVLPVLATALVIAAGTGGRAAGFVPLTDRHSSRLGAISYALYLWHLPALTFVPLFLPARGDVTSGAVIAVSVALAAMTTVLVEKPILASPWLARERRRSRLHRRAEWHDWWQSIGPSVRRSGFVSLCAFACLVLVAALGGTRPGGAARDATAPLTAFDEPSGSKPTAAADGPEVTALQQRISAALAATTWPDLSPSLDSVISDDYLRTVTGTELGAPLRCGDETDKEIAGRSTPSRASCTFGSATAAHHAVIVGDSMAAFLAPAFRAIAEEGGSTWRITTSARFACPFIDLRLQIGDDQAGCQAHNETVVDEILAERPDLVVVANNYSPVEIVGVGAPPTSTQRATGIRAYVDRISPAVSAFAFLAAPPSSANVKTCYSRVSSPRDCVSTTSASWFQAAAVDRDVIEKVSSQAAGEDEADGTDDTATAGEAPTGSAWIDIRPLLCQGTRCPAFIGTTPVKFDGGHLVPQAAAMIAPGLHELMQAAGVMRP